MVAFNRLSDKDAAAIRAYEQLLLNKFPNSIKKLMLFGSKARGDDRRNSDIDILIILARNTKRVTRREITALTHGPIAHFGVELSPVLMDEHRLKEWSPFLAHVKKDAVILWTAPNRDT